MRIRRSAWRWLGLVAATILVMLAAGAPVWWNDRQIELPSSHETTIDPPSSHQTTIERIEDPETPEQEKRTLVLQVAQDPGADATAVLISASRDPSPVVAIAAVKRLIKRARADDRVVEHLIALLESPEFRVRMEAARGLVKVKSESALPALESRFTREDHPVVRPYLRGRIRRLGGRDPGTATQ